MRRHQNAWRRQRREIIWKTIQKMHRIGMGMHSRGFTQNIGCRYYNSIWLQHIVLKASASSAPLAQDGHIVQLHRMFVKWSTVPVDFFEIKFNTFHWPNTMNSFQEPSYVFSVLGSMLFQRVWMTLHLKIYPCIADVWWLTLKTQK